MAVYTEVDDADLLRFVAEYDIGDVLSCKGIAEGVENSNFLLTTSTGPYILTLYEKRVRPDDLPFFLNLMDHLATRGVPSPRPVAARDGTRLRHLSGRPAAIVSFLAGMWVRKPMPEHCTQVGRALADLHQAGADFEMVRKNDLSIGGWRPLLVKSAARADIVRPGLLDELNREVDALEAAWPNDLETGVIHADLFPDNVFFREGRLSGIIDFYFACTDMFAYDLAVCLNAWCFETDRSFNITKANRLLAGYRQVRDIPRDEMANLPVLARGSALRFLLTRLFDWLNTPENAFVTPKDPLEYLEKLRFHRSVTGPEAYGLL